MKKRMHIYYDPEGDYLEIRFGKPTPSYYEELEDDVHERRDDKTNEIKGYAIFNVTKRRGKQVKGLDIDLPLPSLT